jgi:hypothetical protein
MPIASAPPKPGATRVTRTGTAFPRGSVSGPHGFCAWRSGLHHLQPREAHHPAENNMAESDIATIQVTHAASGVALPLLSGTMGPDVVDIRSLTAKTGVFTFDPGFLATASCKSRITYIDGDEGVLLYRGYPIEQLAVHCDFLDVCFLLLRGELPNA